MTIQLLDINAETEQLKACRMSLILGVPSENNGIKNILKFCCSILGAAHGVLCFHTEPYMWYYTPQHLKAFQFHPENVVKIDAKKINSAPTDHLAYIKKLCPSYQRWVNIEIQLKTRVIGYICIFDGQSQAFDSTSIMLIKDYLKSIMDVIQLKEENQELLELYEQKIAVNISKTEYLQTLAHNLRIPFHGLLEYIDVLLNEKERLSKTKYRQIVENLNETALSTYHLLERVLTWSMADDGHFTNHPANFYIKDIVDIVFDALNHTAEKKNVMLVDQVDTNLQVFADLNMMTSVLQNLVSNALKSAPVTRRSRVSISAELVDQEVRIYVKDTGLGMSDQQLKMIFQPLFTTVLDQEIEQGIGLGLMLSKHFVELNSGHMSVQSEPNQGTTFKICLPMKIRSEIDKNPIHDNLILFKKYQNTE